MSRWSRLAVLAAACAVFRGAPPARAQSTTDALATVKFDKCKREPGRIVVTYHLEGALQSEDRKELEGGQTITFTHRIDVYRRRSFFADKWLARRTIETSASLDTLTEQYTLTRKIDDGPAETQSTEKPQAVEKWLGEVRSLAIELPADEDRGSIEVRVKAKYRKTFLLFVWPRELTADGDTECR
jgi:uncharacterized protein DUF4390